MQKENMFFLVLRTCIKYQQPRGYNKKVMTNISPILTSTSCPEKF